MSLIAKKSEIVIDPIPSGTYLARCYCLADLGMQYNQTFKSYANKILFIWELGGTEILVDDEANGKMEKVKKMRVISNNYTNSLNDKGNLKALIESWTGTPLTEDEIKNGYDLSKLVGQYCLISLIVENDKDGKPRNKITGVLKIMAGLPMFNPENENLIYDNDAPDTKVFEKLPMWIQEKIKKAGKMGDKEEQANKGDVIKFDKETGEVQNGINVNELVDKLQKETPTTVKETLIVSNARGF